MEQFRIHKLKQKQGIIEVLVTFTIDILSSPLALGGLKTNLFSLWKKEVDLLEAETKFPGREIAYIYKAKQQFT